MSFRTLVFVLVVLAVLLMVASSPVVDSDTWWHLRAGTWMLEQRQLLRTDPFSTTRLGEPWIYPGWLAQISLAGAYQAAGLAGLHLWTAAILGLTFVLVWLTLEGPLLLRAFVLLLAAATSSVFWSARPHVFSLALAAAMVLLLERFTLKPTRWIWLSVGLMALWPNLHGAFPTGLLLIGLYLLALVLDGLLEVWRGSARPAEAWLRARRGVLTLAACAGLGTLALGLNPHGLALVGYAGRTVSIGVLRDFIQEWQSPDFHDPRSQLFVLMLMLLLAAFAATGRRPATREVLLVTAFAAMAFFAWRNVALFAVIAAPVLSRHAASAMGRLPPLRRRSRDLAPHIARRVNVVLAAGFAVLTGILLVRFLAPGRLEQAALRSMPAAAVRHIRQAALPGPLFNSYNWGAYLLWAIYPEQRSFVDGRTDLFDDPILLEYLQVWRGEPGWDEVLEKWGIRTVLVEPSAPLVLRLEAAGWQEAYADELAVVFTRPAD
jgi:hypothetical protein